MSANNNNNVREQRVKKHTHTHYTGTAYLALYLSLPLFSCDAYNLCRSKRLFFQSEVVVLAARSFENNPLLTNTITAAWYY